MVVCGQPSARTVERAMIRCVFRIVIAGCSIALSIGQSPRHPRKQLASGCAENVSKCDPREDPKSIIVGRIGACIVEVVSTSVELAIKRVLNAHARFEPRSE